MPKVSVIVPVYKVEKYLNRCVESIRNQTLKDIEIILVDDGSPDNCPKMCDDYARMDARIKVIHKRNGGVAAARNTGIELAQGEFITFVDSDDWIEPEMYQIMTGTAQKYNVDVVMCDCVKDYEKHSTIYTHDIRPGYYSYEQLKNEYYPHLIMMENVEYPPTISNWLCLYRQSREVCKNGQEVFQSSIQQYDKHCLRYIEGIRYSEDLLFGARMMYQAKSFYYLKENAFYHYCINLTSATHTFAPDKWNDYRRLYHETEKYFLGRSDFDFRGQIDLMLLFFLYNSIEDIMKFDGLKKEEKEEKVSLILNEKCVTEMFKRISIRRLNISFKQKILTYLYRHKAIKILMMRV